MARKKERKTGKFLLFRNGREYKVLSENGKYYFCNGTQFRKMNPAIAQVLERAAQEEKEVADDADDE